MDVPFEVVQAGPNTFFLSGELDIATVPQLEASLAGAVATGGAILVDLTLVTFIGAIGAEAFRRAARQLPTGCLILHGPSRIVGQVLSLTGVETQEGIHVEACDRDPFPTGDTPGTWAPRPDVARELRRLHRTFVLQRHLAERLRHRATTLCVAAGSSRRRATRLRGEAVAARHAA